MIPSIEETERMPFYRRVVLWVDDAPEDVGSEPMRSDFETLWIEVEDQDNEVLADFGFCAYKEVSVHAVAEALADKAKRIFDRLCDMAVPPACATFFHGMTYIARDWRENTVTVFDGQSLTTKKF